MINNNFEELSLTERYQKDLELKSAADILKYFSQCSVSRKPLAHKIFYKNTVVKHTNKFMIAFVLQVLQSTNLLDRYATNQNILSGIREPLLHLSLNEA